MSRIRSSAPGSESTPIKPPTACFRTWRKTRLSSCVKTVANASKPAYTTENILNFNPTGAIGANSVNHNFAIEYNEVWNAAIQKQLGGSTSLESATSDLERCTPTVPRWSMFRLRSEGLARFRNWPPSHDPLGWVGDVQWDDYQCDAQVQSWAIIRLQLYMVQIDGRRLRYGYHKCRVQPAARSLSP